MSSRTPVRAVFFDVGGTLLRVRSSVGSVYSEVAGESGFDVPVGDLDRRFHRAWSRGIERSRAHGWVASDDTLHHNWWTIVKETFDGAVPEPALRGIFTELYDRFATADAWIVAPHARETLAELRRRGVTLGVLSNWDHRLASVLGSLDLIDEFDFVVVSHEVGVEKPHPDIFRRALERAQVPASAALHVGDSWTADIEAARSLGLGTLWISPEAERAAVSDPGPGVEGFPEAPERFWADWV